MSRNMFDDILLARGLKGLLSPPEMDSAVPKQGSILGGFDYRKPFENGGMENVPFAADKNFAPQARGPSMSASDIWRARALSAEFARSPVANPLVHLAAEIGPPANDSMPAGTPRYEACIEAGHECAEAASNFHETRACWAAEKSCNMAADAMKGADNNAVIFERFPHGRTVVIPAGGQPRLGPMAPIRKR